METNNQLVIIRKIEKYIEYMLTILIKLPRTEKFSIGTEIKTSMYDMLKNILFATKIEKRKRLEYYNFRYMDDIVILCKNKEEAKERLQKLTVFLEEKLKLTLNSKTRIFKNTQGVNFCGYKINSNVIKIRNSSKYRMKRKLKGYTKLLKSGKITLPKIQRSIAGWLGYVKHADSDGLLKSMFYIEG